MNAYNHNFKLMIIGQIISLFGNAILRFSLSLYVLKVSGSASIFATILAVSILPTILLSPFGGVLADRVSRRTIMLGLDFLTSFLIFAFSMISAQHFSIPLVAVLMISLSVIQAFYQPSVQASIPLLVQEEQLMQANGIVVQINALATLLGPILGGLLFSLLPFSLLLNIAATAFFLSAILECIMRIPFQSAPAGGSMLAVIRTDMKESLHFLRYENPALIRLLLLLAALNLVLSSFITVGLPVISNITLALSPAFYGWLEAAIGIGSIAGSMTVPFVMKRVDISGAWRFLLGGSLFLLPMALVLFFKAPVYIAYGCIFVSSICIMLFAALFNIYAQTFLQKSTPNHLLGKVASLVTMVVMCSYPIGQSVYGMLMEHFSSSIALLITGACLASLMISLLSRKALKSIGNDCEMETVLLQ